MYNKILKKYLEEMETRLYQHIDEFNKLEEEKSKDFIKLANLRGTIDSITKEMLLLKKLFSKYQLVKRPAKKSQ